MIKQELLSMIASYHAHKMAYSYKNYDHLVQSVAKFNYPKEELLNTVFNLQESFDTYEQINKKYGSRYIYGI